MSKPWWHPSRFGGQLLLVALLALVVRVVYVLTIATDDPTGGDSLFYHVQANLLADGKGFSEPFTFLETGRLVPTAVHPPVFSLLLAIPSTVGVDSFLAHKLTACVIGTITVVLIALLGRRVGGPRVGVVAGVLAALYPNLWVIDGIFLPEGAFAATIALTLLLAYRAWDSPTLGNAALVGGAIAIATLTRAEAVWLVVLLGVPVLIRAHGPSGAAARAKLVGALVLATVVVLAPWMIRNQVAFDRSVPLTTNSGDVLSQANCDDTYYGEKLGFWSFPCGGGRIPDGDESVRSEFRRERALDYIGDHTGRLPVVAAARVGRIWEVYRPGQNAELSTVEGRDLGVARAGLAAYYVLALLSIVGFVLLVRRKQPVWPIVTPILLVTITAITAYGTVRFRAPAEVSLTVLAAVATVAGWDRLRARKPQQVA